MFRTRETFQKNVIVRNPKKDRADVLLVYPIWVTRGGRGTLQRMLPPLGILSIASYLEQFGLEVHLIDLHAEEIPPQKFREIVRALRPRFVGIEVLSAHFVPAHHVAQICREEVPDVKVAVGGVHAEAEPEQMLRNPCIEVVCRGDGEEVMLDFVQGKPYREILGLSYRDGGKVRHNPPRPLERDLDKYPFPAYHLIDFDNYFPPVSAYKDLPAMNVLMTRGCPGKCTFCNSAMTTLRSRSAESMVELIKMLRYRYGVRQIYFYDDTFTSVPKTVRTFCEKMIADKVDVKWICYARGDMFKDPLVELMARAGCHQILVGIESGSDTLMKDIGKPIKKEHYKDMVDLAHKHGMEVRGSFIIGHLNETRDTMEETLQFAKDIDLDFFQVNILTPYPGTQLYREAKEKGLLLHEEYDKYGQNEVILKLNHLAPEDVLAFDSNSFYRFFLRPRVLWRQIRRLTNWNQIKDLFKVLYIHAIAGYSTHRAANQYLLSWHDYDIEKFADQEIHPPATPRLTYQVRQETVFG